MFCVCVVWDTLCATEPWGGGYETVLTTGRGGALVMCLWFGCFLACIVHVFLFHFFLYLRHVMRTEVQPHIHSLTHIPHTQRLAAQECIFSFPCCAHRVPLYLVLGNYAGNGGFGLVWSSIILVCARAEVDTENK